jgi:hypothetical protein
MIKIMALAAMQTSSAALTISGMAKSGGKNEPKEQINTRLPVALLERIEAFIEKQPIRVTFTALLEKALADWLDEHDPASKAKR